MKTKKIKNKKNFKLSKKKLIIIGIIIIILIAIIAYGYHGAQEAERITQVCDFGIGEKGHFLCWKWRQGTNQEILQNIFG